MIHRIQSATDIPEGVAVQQREIVECAALNLSTATMEYLTAAIEHHRKGFSG